MSKRATAEAHQDEPEELPTDTVRIDLDGPLAGHWTVISREVTGRQLLDQLDGGLAGVLRTIQSRTVEHSFEGDIIDQPISVLVRVMNAWTAYDRAKALDPLGGSGSSRRA